MAVYVYVGLIKIFWLSIKQKSICLLLNKCGRSFLLFFFCEVIGSVLVVHVVLGCVFFKIMLLIIPDGKNIS